MSALDQYFAREVISKLDAVMEKLDIDQTPCAWVIDHDGKDAISLSSECGAALDVDESDDINYCYKCGKKVEISR